MREKEAVEEREAEEELSAVAADEEQHRP